LKDKGSVFFEDLTQTQQDAVWACIPSGSQVETVDKECLKKKTPDFPAIVYEIDRKTPPIKECDKIPH
jgi:hypothetical protein